MPAINVTFQHKIAQGTHQGEKLAVLPFSGNNRPPWGSVLLRPSPCLAQRPVWMGGSEGEERREVWPLQGLGQALGGRQVPVTERRSSTACPSSCLPGCGAHTVLCDLRWILRGELHLLEEGKDYKVPVTQGGPVLDSSVPSVPASNLLFLHFMKNQWSLPLQTLKHFYIFQNPLFSLPLGNNG